MKICLAGTGSRDFIEHEVKKSRFILESFYYFKDWQIPLIKSCDLFLLDSGAFTFFQSGKHVDWNDYVVRYADFINKHNIDLFLELDIDPLIGYENVKKLRAKLESLTGKPCIPVWHKSRGKDDFIQMCKDYDYVAIGGIVSKEISRDEWKYFPWFINKAHEHGVKIHGLGFTSLTELPKYHFDSVDSTSWLSGSRFGHVYRFDGRTIETHYAPPGHKTAYYKHLDVNNIREWVKFQKYAEVYL